jgi:hypothetical protein
MFMMKQVKLTYNSQTIKHYIQWFVEVVLGEKFIDKETLGLWMIENQKQRAFSIDVEIDHWYEEQMTIFDIAI